MKSSEKYDRDQSVTPKSLGLSGLAGCQPLHIPNFGSAVISKVLGAKPYARGPLRGLYVIFARCPHDTLESNYGTGQYLEHFRGHKLSYIWVRLIS